MQRGGRNNPAASHLCFSRPTQLRRLHLSHQGLVQLLLFDKNLAVPMSWQIQKCLPPPAPAVCQIAMCALVHHLGSIFGSCQECPPPHPPISLAERSKQREREGGDVEGEAERVCAGYLESQLLFLETWSSARAQLVFTPNRKDCSQKVKIKRKIKKKSDGSLAWYSKMPLNDARP